MLVHVRGAHVSSVRVHLGDVVCCLLLFGLPVGYTSSLVLYLCLASLLLQHLLLHKTQLLLQVVLLARASIFLLLTLLLLLCQSAVALLLLLMLAVSMQLLRHLACTYLPWIFAEALSAMLSTLLSIASFGATVGASVLGKRSRSKGKSAGEIGSTFGVLVTLVIGMDPRLVL